MIPKGEFHGMFIEMKAPGGKLQPNQKEFQLLAKSMGYEAVVCRGFDEAKKEIQKIVDMPDRDIGRMLVFLHQNRGVFPKRRRELFSKLTDEEIAAMQNAYRRVFEIV
jgi:hypothetical protein